MNEFIDYDTDRSLIDLTSAATLMTKNAPAVVELTEKGILGSGPEPTTGPWVFMGTNENKPFKDPLNTSMCAVVFNSWARAWRVGERNTFEFPTLQLTIYADSTRALSTGQIAKHDAQTKALQVFKAIDPLLNDKSGRPLTWFGTPLLASDRREGPDIGPIPGETNEGLYILTARYAVATY